PDSRGLRERRTVSSVGCREAGDRPGDPRERRAVDAMSERARVGWEKESGTYYEIFGERAGSAPPILLIHGGGATGASWRATPDGRRGWADLLVERGYECWITDWPGTGRSGNRNGIDIDYGDVVDGYRRLLRDVIGEPAVVVCHSMGGAVTWQLVQYESPLVTGVVS